MTDGDRDDGFEATFVVRVPRAEAWDRLEKAAPAVEGLDPPAAGQRWLPGFEGAAEDIEVVPGERLRARKATWPCEGTEVVVVLEDHEAGTRITVVQTGFGDGFAEARRWLGTGWWPIVADLAVYLERGVALGRHLTPWASLGCPVTESPGGLTVGPPAPGGFADQAGLREGDLVVRLAGSPVVSIPDLAVLMRSLRAGTETKVRYLRGADLLSGTGTL
jgi:PDZ domain